MKISDIMRRHIVYFYFISNEKHIFVSLYDDKRNS